MRNLVAVADPRHPHRIVLQDRRLTVPVKPTLTMATGLLTPDRGTAYVHGVDAWGDTQRARGLRRHARRHAPPRLSGPDFLVHVGMHGLDTLPPASASCWPPSIWPRRAEADQHSAGAAKVALSAALIHSRVCSSSTDPSGRRPQISAANIRQILTTTRAEAAPISCPRM